ncbi:MAG: hypothetical protein LAQ69_34380 [Acidobacteriia bacterium]|nr:hypothetical protein [Terriglobia bacterium]
MKRSRQLGFELAILLLATTSFASQLAILCNGFSVRYERCTAVGGVTRLYTGSGYVDIPTAEIDHFELDTPPTARKLAVLLHRLWVSGEVYEPLRNRNQRAMPAAA